MEGVYQGLMEGRRVIYKAEPHRTVSVDACHGARLSPDPPSKPVVGVRSPGGFRVSSTPVAMQPSSSG